MKNKIILIFSITVSILCFGHGFSSENKKIDSERKYEELIGKSFTLMPSPAINQILKCGRHLGFEFLEKPTIRTVNTYQSQAPIQYTIEALVASADLYSTNTNYLKIIIKDENKTIAYIRDSKFYATKLDGRVATSLRGCNFEGNAEQVINEIEKSKTATQIRLGMTTKAVEYETEWGSPDKINTLQTVNGIQSQWVYDKFWKKGFLYFNDKGLLTAIQD